MANYHIATSMKNVLFSLLSWLSPTQSVTAKTSLGMSTGLNHLHLLHISLIRRFHFKSFFTSTAILWDRLPYGCFSDHHNVSLFKLMSNIYLSPIVSISHFFLYLEWLSGLLFSKTKDT